MSVNTSILRKVTTLDGHIARVWYISWSPDGKLLASCSQDQSIIIWGKGDHNQWVMKLKFTGHSGTVRKINWSSDGKQLVSCSFDKKTIIYKISQPSPTEMEAVAISVLDGHESEVKDACFSYGNSDMLGTCGRDRQVIVWAVTDPIECIAQMTGHTQDIKCLAWHPTYTHLLVSGSYDNSIRFWLDPAVDRSGAFNKDLGEEVSDSWLQVELHEDHKSTVWDIAFESENKKRKKLSEKEKLSEREKLSEKDEQKEKEQQINIESRKDIKHDQQKDDEQTDKDSCSVVDDNAILPYGNSFQPRMLSCSADSSVIVWVRPINNHPYRPSQIIKDPFEEGSVIFKASVAQFAAGGNDNTLRIFTEDPINHQFFLEASVPDAHNSDINCVRFNPVETQYLATCSDDMLIHIWEVVEQASQ
ncbi:MAG: cytosolic iron-sulfur assembly component 1 [Streblomastix strix]|uniref:Cytosolic iron-sulfur assembly component 1 n=1 Tax=Streblomastix strix TaxID=222440 RepID=A0A5J4X549_9EUKA|nr:MAG: cytosolic iron-sulfur assembly component 1 [Streblomastix strix]